MSNHKAGTMDAIAQEVSQAARRLRRSPAFTLDRGSRDRGARGMLGAGTPRRAPEPRRRAARQLTPYAFDGSRAR
jgi:hypothetical protein